MSKPYGYIYRTINLISGQFYIGKKAYTYRKKKKLTKKELAAIKTKGRKPTYKYVEVDSGWKDYYGSSLELKADVEKYGKENFKVEILQECRDRKSLSYYEVWWMFKFDVLASNTYNQNILGRFFRKDL